MYENPRILSRATLRWPLDLDAWKQLLVASPVPDEAASTYVGKRLQRADALDASSRFEVTSRRVSDEYVVRKGDCLSSIAKAHGFSDWRSIYNHPANAAFRLKRPDPNLIYPGDVLRIPDGKHNVFPAETGMIHTFKVTIVRTRKRIRLEVLVPYAHTVIIDGVPHSRRSNGRAPIELPIRADLVHGTLRLWPANDNESAASVFDLYFGESDPIEEWSGIQGRLANLGYYAGPVDGKRSPALDNAVREFQIAEKLDPSPGFDATTRDRLRVRHDGE